MRTAARYKNIIATIATILLVVFSSVSGGAVSVRAAVSASPAEKYEAQNVWTDLQGAKIDGKGIDLSLYNFDESKNAQVLSFVEFCYAFNTDKQSDYGLYTYVYNPRGFDWTKNEQLNKIQLNNNKYPLKYLNMSTEAGYEGLFYKFKVDLTEEERTIMLGALNSSSRVYEVGEIELYHTGANATAYNVGNTFTYTGYAKGYGSDSATDDTLNCTSSGLMTLTLDVHPTSYRPDGTNGKDAYTRDSLHSVYFSIPNKILDEYGGLSAVHATWLNAVTTPMFVTGNKTVYDEIFKYVGATIPEYNDFRTTCAYGFTTDKVVYNAYNGFSLPEMYLLNYVFYSAGGINSADKYVLPSTELLKWAQTYTEKYSNRGTISGGSGGGSGGDIIGGGSSGGGGGGGGSRPASIIKSSGNLEMHPGTGGGNINIGGNLGGNGDSSGNNTSGSDSLVLGKYSAKLFESIDKEFTEVNISADDKYTLTSEKLTQSFWQKLWGKTGTKVESIIPLTDIQAVYPVKKEDIKLTAEETSKALYISENDYVDFKKYYESATKKKETVFLFRYQISEYSCYECTEFQWLSGSTYKKLDTNAYLAQETVNLDFDIIDVTCTKGDVATVIACVMSPMDIFHELEPPTFTTTDPSDFWKWALTVSVILIALFVGVRVVKSIIKKGRENL